ncbi:MAG: 1-acyl-sn-glycerol-3-phosphate acyltransferase [Spirochaetaceae bacterium]|nr:MAG: 1-acyl-sn-glycerol-3-phosphate acyltransferase [Spirochaetaceae bacterium]
MMKPFIEGYPEIALEIMNAATQDNVVTPHNVYQQGIHQNKAIITRIVNELLLPGSTIEGFENLVELFQLAKDGKSCLLFMQHFSNFDLPNMYELLARRGSEGEAIMNSIIAIAGLKLNEEHDLVRGFTEAFTRLVICPSSFLKDITDDEELKEANIKRNAINMAAMWQLMRLKNKGHIILVFPTGTRYRPWDPSTGKGLTEVYPYVKSFNYMVLVSINGNTLRVNPNGKMEEDLATRDLVIYSVSKVINCRDYRHELDHERVKEDSREHNHHDSKEFIVDSIMAEMNRMHEETEKKRMELLAAIECKPE